MSFRSVRVNYGTDITNINLASQGSTLQNIVSGTPSLIFPGQPNPNEPPGFTRFAEYNFTDKVLHGIGNSNGQEIDGCIWKWNPGDGNMLPIQDPTAPFSPQSVMDYSFPVGQPSGSGAGLYQLWDLCGESINTSFSKFYLSTRIKLAGGALGDQPDWEGHHVLTKFMGYTGNGRNSQGATPTNFIGNMIGSGNESDRFRTNFAIQCIQQDITSRAFPTNTGLTPNRIIVGQWHHIEWLMEIGTINVADGTFKYWLDGVLIMDYSDVLWHTTAFPSGFWGRRFDPVWGGQGTVPKSRQDHIYLDHEYMSGVI